jgi:flagellar assembly protein FliH
LTAPFVFEQLESQGELVTASGTPADRAAEIVAEAHVRAGEIEREAREAGFEAGRAEVIARAEAEMEAPRAAVLAAVDAVYAARNELTEAVELRSIELGIAVAGRILGAALEVKPELVCEVVGSALRRAIVRDRLVIDVNPDDLEVVRTWLGSSGEEGNEAIEVRPERRVARGGCVVHTAEGEIDAQLTEQLDRAEQILRRTFSESAAAAE